MLKQFEEERWQQYDTPAKDAAMKFWQRRGYSCLENPDEFGVDLLVEGKGKKFGCEVEVKTKWFGAEFTFPTLQIALQKRKFMDVPCQFIIFNHSLSHAALVARKRVLCSLVVELKNVPVPAGERFYDVPVSGVVILNMLV